MEIKNIILDVGGILFDDSKKNIEQILNKNCDLIYKCAYGSGFKDCLLGHKTVSEHIDSLFGLPDFDDISYILNISNLPITFPLMKKNLEYIKTLKAKGYKLFLLTNITEDGFNYINSVLDIDNSFDGGIYSYQEHLIKPDFSIYNLLIDRFNLNKEECIFFDDKKRNVIASNSVGIKSAVFNSIDDIKNNI